MESLKQITVLSELISVSMNNGLRYNFFHYANGSSDFNPCLNMIAKVGELLNNIDMNITTKLVQELPTKQLEFLLEFVVFYFEVGDAWLTRLLTRILNDDKLKKLFNILYRTIDIYRSDIHILAFLYLTYLGHLRRFNTIGSFILEHPDEIKKTYIRKHILNSSKIRTISIDCKQEILKVARYKSTNDFLIFCYNNNKIFDLFYQINIIANILSSEDVPNYAISIGTSKAVIETFLYSKLNVYQILACLNTNDDYFLTKIIGGCTDAFVINRIAKLIKTYPQLPSIINSNMILYRRAFIIYCCFLNKMLKYACKKTHTYKNEVSRDVYDAVCGLINKNNVEIISENFLLSGINSYVADNIFREIIFSVFLSNKTIDDSFILRILYNGVYEKTLISVTNVTNLGYLYLCLSRRVGTSYVWYNIAKRHGHSNKIPSVGINGINDQNIIRHNLCITHFLLKFGINKWHRLCKKKSYLGEFLQTLDKLNCKIASSRARINKSFSLRPIERFYN